VRKTFAPLFEEPGNHPLEERGLDIANSASTTAHVPLRYWPSEHKLHLGPGGDWSYQQASAEFGSHQYAAHSALSHGLTEAAASRPNPAASPASVATNSSPTFAACATRTGIEGDR
jgi:hypothetical protein